MDLNEIQDLIKFVSKSGASEVELETKDFKITIKAPGKKKGGSTDAEPQIIQATLPYGAPMPNMQNMQPPMPQPQAAPQQPAQQAETAEKPKKDAATDDSNYITVKSPMIGTFYRSPAPDKPPFISVGDDIKEGQTICIIEAMKLFNEIESEISGKVVKVLVEDATPVEYDQPLFLVEPA